MKRFSEMTDEEVREEIWMIKRKLDSLEKHGGVMLGIRVRWGLAKYQNMVEECLRRGITISDIN